MNRQDFLRHNRSLLVASLAATCSLSFAFDDIESLQGKLVLYAGELESVDCPISGKYDCSTWPMTMLKTRKGPEICFGSSKYVRCSYKCTGLIAVGDDKVPKAYVFSAMGSDATEAGHRSNGESRQPAAGQGRLSQEPGGSCGSWSRRATSPSSLPTPFAVGGPALGRLGW